MVALAVCRRPPRRLYGVKVVYVDGIKGCPECGGMNCRAARYYHAPFPWPCGTVEIDRAQSCRVIRDTIRHEVVEKALMAGGLPYPRAHALAG